VRRLGDVVLRIAAPAVAVAAIGALLGFLVAHFLVHTDPAAGVYWGLTIAGFIVGFLGGGSGRPEQRALVWGPRWGARLYRAETSTSTDAPRPRSSLPVVVGGLLVFALGVALLIGMY
jgi:hypothetical protein